MKKYILEFEFLARKENGKFARGSNGVEVESDAPDFHKLPKFHIELIALVENHYKVSVIGMKIRTPRELEHEKA